MTHDTPNAKNPTELAQELTSIDGIDHTTAGSSFKRAGTTFKVVAFINGDAPATVVSDVVSRCSPEGYEIGHVIERSSGNVDVKMVAETDERND